MCFDGNEKCKSTISGRKDSVRYHAWLLHRGRVLLCVLPCRDAVRGEVPRPDASLSERERFYEDWCVSAVGWGRLFHPRRVGIGAAAGLIYSDPIVEPNSGQAAIRVVLRRFVRARRLEPFLLHAAAWAGVLRPTANLDSVELRGLDPRCGRRNRLGGIYPTI